MPLFESVSDSRRYPLQLRPWDGGCDGSIFQQTSLGVYVTDHQGKTLYVNDSYVRISGLPREEVVGRRMDELVRQGYFDHSATLLVLQSLRPEKIKQRIRNEVSVIATGNPVLDGEGFVHYVITLVQPCNGDSVEGRGAQKTFICESPPMKAVLADAEKAAAFDIPVLIQGATGTGKEVLSQWIHENSRRADGPFIRVNCAALSDDLLDAELFGYGPGAFTGAQRQGKKGLLEAASKGTLFLDEIGDMPLPTQVKLLRALENQRIRRIGETEEREIDIRVICATNKDLAALVEQGKFRADLFHRIDGIRLHLPDLNERREDIQPLARLFWRQLIEKYGIPKELSSDLSVLEQFAWPGNVRELKNFMQKLYVLAGDRVSPDDMKRFAEKFGNRPKPVRDLKSRMKEIEKRIIRETIQREGSVSNAARVLKIDRSTLFRKLKG